MQLALEVHTSWGDSLLDTRTLSAGSAATFEDVAVASSDAGFSVELPPRFTGSVLQSGGAVALAPAMFPYALGPQESLVASDGRVRVEMHYVRRAAIAGPSWLEELEYRWLNIWLLAMFLHAMLVSAFLVPTSTRELADGAERSHPRYRAEELILAKARPPVPGEGGGSGEGGGFGAAGKRDPEHARQPIPATATFKKKGIYDGKRQAEVALSALFKHGDVAVFGTGGLGTSLENALGDVRGREVDAGLGDLRTRGAGPGGPGEGSGLGGLGALGNVGRSVGPTALMGYRGDLGDAAYGDGIAGAGRLQKSEHALVVEQRGPVRVEGALSKDVIHAVIRENLAQIRYCYERELQRTPGLFGKVATEFVIGSTGQVRSSAITQSTMKNDAVERCVLAKIGRWVFPEPRGGGEVVVKYPFLFRPAG